MNRRITNKLATIVFVLCAAIMSITLVYLLGYILTSGLSYVDMDFLTSNSSSFQEGGGIKNQLWNSFYILVVTMIFSVPLGVLGGIYLAEYAKPGKLTNVIRTSVEVLSSLPSIVVGMFGLLVFVQYAGLGYSIIAGALALTVFNLPIIVRVTEDSLRAIPVKQKNASLALGITHWHTVKTVLVPAAFPGILTGVLLSAGRVFGEAAALLFTAGLSTRNLDFGTWDPFDSTSPLNPFRSAETLSVHIWKVNSQGIMPDLDAIANGSAAVLIIFVLIFNVTARVIGNMIFNKITGSK
ncbi:putative ABC transporter permease protein YqgI [Thalassobacillus devorans]|uniref:Phosphate transport system permease protein PstA n=1 Tax=Thalassobacillus devorans TaxID=279813 RepID=A0ABQ1P616_9BACI|nr:phosphate ABC transporter permease PstA [Thalassobacillus devorans]NIK29658.1 phosphate transport system permease protein [Thalassobacillus devorans]GGC91809.1 putative ABC transporter permease protein YqgI [Thalassobacillus devorans]